MRHITKTLIFGILFIGPLSANADPITFSFHQGGFDEGAVVTGSFVGQDLNNNEQLSSFDGEIFDFMMSFSGNSFVSAFSLGFGSLLDFGLVYDLDGGPLGDGIGLGVEGILAIGDLFGYVAGPGPADICGIGFLCAAVGDFKDDGISFSDELVWVSGPATVPEPGTLAMLGIGLAGIGFTRRRRKA
jgi:hypothetical protein